MISLATSVKIHVCVAPTDMRKGFDGLCGLAEHVLKQDPDTTAGANDRIRKTYDGPLSLAEDFMVWNITKDKITERMGVVEERTWAPPPASPAQVPNMAELYEEIDGLLTMASD